MKNSPLQLAVITSLIQKSLLLTDQKKKALLQKLPSLTPSQIEEVQTLIGQEEQIVLHPKELGLEEILNVADARGLKELNGLLETSLEALRRVEQKSGEEMDTQNAEAILRNLS